MQLKKKNTHTHAQARAHTHTHTDDRDDNSTRTPTFGLVRSLASALTTGRAARDRRVGSEINGRRSLPILSSKDDKQKRDIGVSGARALIGIRRHGLHLFGSPNRALRERDKARPRFAIAHSIKQSPRRWSTQEPASRQASRLLRLPSCPIVVARPGKRPAQTPWTCSNSEWKEEGRRRRKQPAGRPGAFCVVALSQETCDSGSRLR